MTRNVFVRSAAIVALQLLGATVCLAQQRDLAGVYRCEGTNPNGTGYRATVEITKDDQTYIVRWAGPNATSIGIGLQRGDVLAVSYFTGENIGLVLYTIGKGGPLTGEWTVLGAGGLVFRETLTKVGVEAEQRRPGEAFEPADSRYRRITIAPSM